MSGRRTMIAAVAGLALGVARPAAATISVGGSVGGGYARSDSWSAEHAGATGWDWEAAMALAGSPLRPGLLQWSLAADYRGVRTIYGPLASRADGFGFQLQCALLSATVLPISLSGSRSWSEFSSDASSQAVGASMITALGGTAALRVPRYPALHLALGHNETETTSLGGPPSSSETTTLSAGLAHNAGNHSYSLDYGTGWNHGTFAESNYRSHTLALQLASAPSDTVQFRLYERYHLRDPTNDSPMNPRYDDTALGAGVQWRPGPRTTSSFGYSYRHLLVEAPTAPALEQLGHGIAAGQYFRLRPTLALNGNTGFSYALERRGDEGREGVGGSVGAGLSWHRVLGRTAVNAGGGGSVGLVAPATGDVSGAYGVSGSGGASWDRERWRATVSYTGSYASRLAAQSGYTLDQRLQANADGIAGQTAYWRALVTVAGGRRQDDLFGATLYRSASATVAASRRRVSVDLSAGESDGLSSALGDPGFSDGLFLPAEWNTHTRYLTLGSSQFFDLGRLSLREMARTLTSQAPGRPDQWESALAVSAGYAIGAVTVSVDERLSVGGTAGSRTTINVIMVRLARSFGGAF